MRRRRRRWRRLTGAVASLAVLFIAVSLAAESARTAVSGAFLAIVFYAVMRRFLL